MTTSERDLAIKEYLSKLSPEGRDHLLHRRVSVFGPAMVRAYSTAIASTQFVEDVELEGIYIYPEALKFFEVNEVRVGAEAIAKSDIFFKDGYLDLKHKVLPALVWVLISVSSRFDDHEKPFYGTVFAKVKS